MLMMIPIRFHEKSCWGSGLDYKFLKYCDMRKIGLILVLIIGLANTGCEDVLERQPYSIITAQNMWLTEADATAGIIAMYNRFRNQFNDQKYLMWFEFRSGFWTTGESGAAQWNDYFFNQPNTTMGSLDWSGFYLLINTANLAIKYIPQTDFGSMARKNTLIAEAYFVRAYVYFALARLWGDVPLVVDPYESYDEEKLFPARTSVGLVFDQIKADLDKALAHMDDKSPRNRVMVSEAAIQMLKADVYLWTAKRRNGGAADLQTALTAVNSVMNNSSYQLLPNYEQVFRNWRNNEIIFSIYFSIEEASDQFGWALLLQSGMVPARLHNNPVIVNTRAQWHSFTDHYLNNYVYHTVGDTRAGVLNQDYLDVVANRRWRWVNKYLGEMVGGVRNDVSETPIYRYAEAILFKAEILNALDRTPEAIAELNKIAKRAYSVDNFYSGAISKQQADQYILHERLIELGAEAKSWFDIIRFGKAFEIIPSLVGRENEYQGNILLLPVAPGTLTKNPSIQQTPGFN
jgi:starch-binding outer membrane protein, SusD/RagB family